MIPAINLCYEFIENEFDCLYRGAQKGILKVPLPP